LARLGCTRIGSPGIFGVPDRKRCACNGLLFVVSKRCGPSCLGEQEKRSVESLSVEQSRALAKLLEVAADLIEPP
jgi:hypothetical protein